MDDITEDYKTSLADLTQNSKPLINMLTMLAEDNETHATKIVEVTETHLQQVESTKKLPTLYLIDSIIKNLPKSTYPGLFSHNIVSIFCNMFEQVDEKTRQCMFKVRQTWNQHFTGRKMYALDMRVNNIDHAWPLSTPTSNISPIIHLNPKFLQQQREESLPLPDLSPIEDDEAEMRRLLIAKQAELLKLQQKRLELELKETETRLAQQKKTLTDVFACVERETASQLGGETTVLSTQLAASQTVPRDPRLRDNRYPQMASRDPRVCRDPRMRNKHKDKKRSDPRKSASDFRSKESKEREIIELKASSSRNSRTRTRSSNNDSKSGSESKEGTKSKNKEDHDNRKSQIEEEKDHGKTQNVDNQRGKGKRTPVDHDSRKRNGAGDDREKGINWSDSRNRRSKSPRLSHEKSRLPVKDSGRGSKNPPRKNKAKNELKNNNKKQMEEQPKLEHRKPISSLPRIPKRTGTDVDERVMEKDHDERRLSSSNKRDLDERHDYREHEPVRSSKKPRIGQERDLPTIEPVTVHTKMNEDIRMRNKPKDKKRADPRKSASDFRSKESKEREICESKASSSRNSRTRTRSSNNDSKSGSESKEGTKSKNKEDHDNGKSQIEEEKDHGKTQNVDNQRCKGNRTPVDHDSRKRNGAGDDREKGINWSDSRNRRSKSPRLSHEKSRLPVKDSGRGSKNSRRKNKAINELKNNNNKQTKELPKLEHRKPISSLPRIPKRTGTHVDERVTERDHNERRLSSSNKRDLDESHDYGEHEPVRTSKKPRISQERDVPTIKQVTVHTKMNEDISNSRRNNPSEPSMEFQSPIKEPRNLPHDADMRRDDCPPVFDDLCREDGLPRGIPLDRNRDFDRTDRTRAAERTQEDVHTYKESDRPSHRATDGNPNQPQDGMLGLMPPQPPTLQPQLNVESLLPKLIKADLINANTDEAKEKSEKKEPVQKDLQKKKEEDNSEEGKEKRKPVRIKPSKVEEVPDLTEMKSNKLKQQYIGVIQRMYSGKQCTSCSTCFMASQTKLYREHLYWHFRQNQRKKKGEKISRYRSWFYELKDWLDYEVVGDAEERGSPNQPQDGMPGMMPPQPPTLQPQLNDESSLQKFIKAGVINANTDEAKETSENKEPVKDLQKKKEEDNSGEGKEKRTPVDRLDYEDVGDAEERVYSPELTQAPSSYEETVLADLEKKLISSFPNSNRLRGRKLQSKTSFNYLLLDPRVTNNLPSRMNSLGDEKSFKVFVDGIFYVGKGTGTRPYSHLRKAIEQEKKTELQVSDNVKCIQDIWSGNVGVISLQCFQNVISSEAHTREACMIDAIGLNSLANQKKGSYQGISKTWGEKQRKNMGVYFLKKALQIFKGEGEKQICRDNI